MAFGFLRRLFGRAPRECTHLGMAQDVTPSSVDTCPQCIETDDTWVNLRVCLICGQVGCCDNSKNTHATKHFKETGHALLQSYQPGERGRYCYLDEVMLPEAEPFREG